MSARIALGFLVAAVALGGAGTAPGKSHPVRPLPKDLAIVLGSKIGPVRIGMSQRQVVAILGKPARVEGVGTIVTQASYWFSDRITGGDFRVTYSLAGRVVAVSTNNPSFQARSPEEYGRKLSVVGLHTGILLHTAPCKVLGYYGSCDPQLIGFQLLSDVCGGSGTSDQNVAWVKTYRGIVTMVFLDVEPPDFGPAQGEMNKVNQIDIGTPLTTTGQFCN